MESISKFAHSSARQIFRSKVLKVCVISPKVVCVELQVPQSFSFHPGQWVDVIVSRNNELAKQQLSETFCFDKGFQKEFIKDLKDDPLDRDEFYNVTGFSMTSSPFVKEKITLGIKLTDHYITNFMHNHVKEGHVLNVAGPGGTFILPYQEFTNKTKRQLFLIGAGIGITPLLSIFHFIKDLNKLQNIEKISTTLLYSCRSEVECYFREEIINTTIDSDGTHKVHFFQSNTPDNYFVPSDNDQIQTHSGRIHIDNLKSCVDHTSIKDGIFMLCGPQPFIYDLEDQLSTLGVPRDRMHYEKWW
ncbi:ferredoxin-NADP reductase [Acrasis kona]|uniref:Oxidoreductase NAD-binding domain-containing protein 1 n=1 Tax=Acrasis kona TaxID=1008807 RepID=A0AAW2ZEY1_9EUKA